MWIRIHANHWRLTFLCEVPAQASCNWKQLILALIKPKEQGELFHFLKPLRCITMETKEGWTSRRRRPCRVRSAQFAVPSVWVMRSMALSSRVRSFSNVNLLEFFLMKRLHWVQGELQGARFRLDSRWISATKRVNETFTGLFCELKNGHFRRTVIDTIDWFCQLIYLFINYYWSTFQHCTKTLKGQQ